ncbi:MAG: EamA family transporter [Bacilli bacterium]|jgi:drug/metabolite transporter (DMT)-like permease|nr:EamA family transporter [Bacilli bacterium]
MKGTKSAFLWSVLHSIGDAIEENILLKFNESEYLFWSNLVTGFMIVIFSLLGGIELSWISFIVLIFYAFAIIGGDFCYVKAIQTLPLGLANLIDAGSLFIILICDICLGYIKPNFLFFVLFGIFFCAVSVFTYETNRLKEEVINKKIDLKNICILITSTIFYASEPYFIKLANSKGANEYGINLVYYLIAVPVFFLLYQKEKRKIVPMTLSQKKYFWKNIFLLGSIYAFTSILYMLAYMDQTPIMITLIMKLQLFFVVIISVICKTDKMNWKKMLSLIIGVICLIWMSFL